MGGAEYEPAQLKLHDIEKYWVSYLPLISAASKGDVLDRALNEADEAFRRRNVDTALEDDWYGIEGYGTDPVYWDFRRDGLLQYVKIRGQQR